MDKLTGETQIALRREYQQWVARFWQNHTTLSQIVLEDFPDPDDASKQPTQYHVAAMRDLAQSEGALVAGYEHQ